MKIALKCKPFLLSNCKSLCCVHQWIEHSQWSWDEPFHVSRIWNNSATYWSLVPWWSRSKYSSSKGGGYRVWGNLKKKIYPSKPLKWRRNSQNSLVTNCLTAKEVISGATIVMQEKDTNINTASFHKQHSNYQMIWFGDYVQEINIEIYCIYAKKNQAELWQQGRSCGTNWNDAETLGRISYWDVRFE